MCSDNESFDDESYNEDDDDGDDDDQDMSCTDESDFDDSCNESNNDFFKKPKNDLKNDKYVPPGKRAQSSANAASSLKSKKVRFSDAMTSEDEADPNDYENNEITTTSSGEESSDEKSLTKSGLKEDIYGRLVDKKGNVVKSEKYVPPAQRLKTLLENSSTNANRKLTNLSKQLNGLLNRLSTANMHSISNQIIQLFYSNQHTRYDLIETLFNLFNSSLIRRENLSPINLLIEHAALVAILSANIGVELGANFLQKFSSILHKELTSSNEASFSIENKTLDNLILFLCQLYNFKLFSSSLISDLLSDFLVENLSMASSSDADVVRVEKSIDLILLVLRCVGFSLRKEDPVALKNMIVKLQVGMEIVQINS